MASLRELFEGDGLTLGGWCVIPSSFSAELMGRSGWDWVCVDMQHGLVGYEQTSCMLQALAITSTPTLVRVPWNQPDYIMKALDAGAQGVIVPMVGTADDAQRAVDAMKYPPVGMRSWGPIRASFDHDGYSPATANRRTVLAAMIETQEGFANMDEIMSVEGVDVIYVGPSDLGLSHGHVPTLSPEVGSEHEKLILELAEGCKRHGLVAGIHADSAETAARWRDAGYRMITIASDGVLLRQASAAAMGALRGGGHLAAPQPTSAYA